MDVVGVEGWSKQWVSLGDTSIEDANGNVLTINRTSRSGNDSRCGCTGIARRVATVSKLSACLAESKPPTRSAVRPPGATQNHR